MVVQTHAGIQRKTLQILLHEDIACDIVQFLVVGIIFGLGITERIAAIPQHVHAGRQRVALEELRRFVQVETTHVVGGMEYILLRRGGSRMAVIDEVVAPVIEQVQ